MDEIEILEWMKQNCSSGTAQGSSCCGPSFSCCGYPEVSEEDKNTEVKN